jgi:glycosyltransferase involved in cell wall biosynthesis
MASSAAPCTRVVFVLTALELGGAEMMLWKILSRIDRGRVDPAVIVLSGDTGALVPRFLDSRIECRFLGMHDVMDAASGLLRLRAALRDLRPDVVQGWMYQGNLAATLGSLMAGGTRRLVWAVRAGLTDLGQEEWRVALPIRLGARLSFIPDKIINNSLASALEHERFGYRADKRLIVPNGFDPKLFKPDGEARTSLRRELGLAGDALLIGLIARYHWVKDHGTFLRAAGELKQLHPHVHYVLAGDDIEPTNPNLAQLVRDNDLASHVHLLGRRDDIPALTAALDIAVSSSIAESFSNTIGEAMSCGVPCVATDVGDSSRVIGDTGSSVPPGDAHGLARALGELVVAGHAARAALGAKARQRIIENYSLDAIVREYECIYAGAAGAPSS